MEITKNGKTYTNITDVSKTTGYDREYLRKLAIARKIDGQQVESAWFINMESLHEYQKGRGNRGPHGSKAGK